MRMAGLSFYRADVLILTGPVEPRGGGPRLHTKMTIVALLGLLVTISVVGIPGVPWVPFGLANQYRVDLDVYRLGARAWIENTPLYGPGFPVTELGQPLPFIYPPVAAVLFTPLMVVSLATASVLMTLLSIAAVIRVAFLTVRALGHPVEPWRFAAALPLVLLTDPVRMTLMLGQINLLLLAAVFTDILGDPRRRMRGALVGLAAAVKLTPLVFVVWFLIRGDRRGACNAVVAFGAATAIGFLLAPAESVQFFTQQIFGLDALLSPASPNNQNLRAVITRLDISNTSATVLWLAVAVGTLLLGAVAARRCHRAGEAVLGLTTLSLAAVLASPISWEHHWVWAMPILPALAAVAARHNRPAAARLAGTGLALLAVGPQWLVIAFVGLADVEEPWQQVVSASYVIWGVTALIAVASGRLERVRGSTREQKLQAAAGCWARRAATHSPQTCSSRRICPGVVTSPWTYAGRTVHPGRLRARVGVHAEASPSREADPGVTGQ